MASIFVANLLRYEAARATSPDRDIILALTADEEGGDANGAEWLVKDHRDLIDAAYALNEGGGGALRSADVKPLFNSVRRRKRSTATSRSRRRIAADTRPCRATTTRSMSWLEALARHREVPVSGRAQSTTRGVLRADGEGRDAGDRRGDARDRREPERRRGRGDAVDAIRATASMLRTTCVATRLAGGHAYNALPQTATANVNCRMAPTSSSAEVRATLARVDCRHGHQDHEHAGDRAATSRNPRCRVDPALLAATTEITTRMFGDIPVVPTMSTGATDSHYFRAVGIPAYGVSGIFSLPARRTRTAATRSCA